MFAVVIVVTICTDKKTGIEDCGSTLRPVMAVKSHTWSRLSPHKNPSMAPQRPQAKASEIWSTLTSTRRFRITGPHPSSHTDQLHRGVVFHQHRAHPETARSKAAG